MYNFPESLPVTYKLLFKNYFKTFLNVFYLKKLTIDLM